MFRRVIAVAVVLLAGCGSERHEPQTPPDQGSPPPATVGTVSFTTMALTGTAGPVKVVLNVANPVYTPVTVYDPNTDSDVPVACTTDANCASSADATCRDSVCVTITGYSNSIMYVKNQSGTHRLDSVIVPCDGQSHTIEVYATNQTAEPFLMTDMKFSKAFKMTSSPSSCTAPAETEASDFYDNWAPGLAFPQIYVGLPAPYDTYVVKARNLKYPFSSTWSVAEGTLVTSPVFSFTVAQDPLGYSRAGATFAAPTANGSLDFLAYFYLDRSLLVGSEGPTSWTRRVTDSTTPVMSGTAPLP